MTSIRRKWIDIDRAQLSRLQSEDTLLHGYRDETRTQRKGYQEVTFEPKKGMWYQLYKHPKVNMGEQIHQVIVPKTLRKQIMEIAHKSVMSGHLGIRRETGSSTTSGGLGSKAT